MKNSFATKGMGRIFIFIISVIFISSYIKAEPAAKVSKTANEGYIVRALQHISPAQAIKHLSKLKLGTVSQLSTSNTILVTAGQNDLRRASAILSVIDSNEPYEIERILPASAMDKMPSAEEITEKVDGISISTLAEFTRRTEGKSPVIIDNYKESVVLIAPVSKIESIKFVISAAHKAESTEIALPKAEKAIEIKPPAIVTEPNKIVFVEPNTTVKVVEPPKQPETNDVNTAENAFFNKLIESVAKEEEKSSENQPAAITEANETKTEAAISEEKAESKAEIKAEPNTVGKAEPNAIAGKKGTKAVETGHGSSKIVLGENRAAELALARQEIPIRSYTPEPNALAEEELELNLPEKLNVIDLLDLVGKYLHLDYMYNADEVKGEVTLRVQGKIKVKELYPLAENLLKFKGFVMSRKDNFVTIVPKEKVLEIDPELLSSKEDRVRYGDAVITQVFNLSFIDPTSAKTLLDDMKLGANLRAVPETSSLIVTEFAYRMARIEQMLRLIDKPGEPKQFRYRQLKYTMAATLAPQVKSLVEQLGEISITISTRSTAAQQPTTAAQRRAARRIQPTTPPGQPAQPGAAPEAAAGQAANKPTIYLDADERTNRVLMIGMENELNIVDDLISALDVEQQDLRSMRLYQIQFVGAEDIMQKLQELNIISGTEAMGRYGYGQYGRGERSARDRERERMAQQQGTAQPGQPLTPTTTQTGTEMQPLVEEPQVVIIEASNSLLVNATPEQHAQISTIIGYIDVEPEGRSSNYVIYTLESQNPKDLKGILDNLIKETVTESSTGPSDKGEKDAKIIRTTTTSTTSKRTEEDITIVADEKTYSLIVYANKKNQQWISTLIKQLDEYRPQVLLDCTLVEITKDDAFKLDIDLVTKIPRLAPTPGGNMQSQGLVTALLAPFPGNTVKEASSIPSVNSSGTAFYADRHIQMLIEAMERNGYGRILSKPKILVNDNEEGTINSEKKQYIAQEQTTFIPGSAPGTSNQTSQITFTGYDAGVKLTIKPHISKKDQLKLEVTLERKDFTPTADAQFRDGNNIKTVPTPPNTSTNNIKTVVTVPDKSTIILGGLEELTQNKTGVKTPLLGDIPFIGGLFKNTNNVDSQNRLYIFVKAYILRPGEELTGNSDIEVVSKQNRKKFEESETKFQKLQDWPGLEQKPMDPIRVLEEDTDGMGVLTSEFPKQKKAVKRK